MPGKEKKGILVLGVGNILLRDEGLGVHAVNALLTRYQFSPNVEVVDGGTQGLRLLESILEADRVIAVDAVKQGGMPGSVYRLEFEEAKRTSNVKNSLHELDLVETLGCAELLGGLPPTVIVGIEPEDIMSWDDTLSETVRERLEDLLACVLNEIEKAGGSFKEVIPEDPESARCD